MANQTPVQKAPLHSEALINKEHLNNDLRLIQEHARVDTIVPEITTLRGLKRRIAIWATKFVLYFSRVFTKRQSQVNVSTLNILQNFTEGFDRLEVSLKDLNKNLLDVKTGLLSQEYRLNKLLDQSKQDSTNGDGAQTMKSHSSEAAHALDAFYLAFENKFRGTRAEVKEKLKIYLPHIEKLENRHRRLTSLDIGCGRGEWLEIMKEKNIDSTGVDTNRLQLEECRRRGYHVAEGDLLHYLRKMSDRSVSLVTGFHVIEHLPFPDLVRVFDEAFRALEPGGMVIFETPNPENTDVGSCLFYVDPTHYHPLYPATIQFLIEQRGYVQVEIQRLNMDRGVSAPKLLPTEHELAAQINPAIELLINRFFAPQDFAVIARKPNA